MQATSLHATFSSTIIAHCLCTRQSSSAKSLHKRPTGRLGATRHSHMQQLKAVWAFDFDGVVCDSVGESSVSAWKAATRVWPTVFNSEEAKQSRPSVLEKMRAARPVIETGYENIVQVRCLLEGVTVEDILENWHSLLPGYMEKWGLERSKLVETFGTTRDDWMVEDLPGWLEMNGIYEGLSHILQHAIAEDELYIVTTKQARFTEILLRDMANVPLPADRIFSQAESGRPKTEVLQLLEERHPGTTYHFVEDKLGTLEKVIDHPNLQDWKLYLVDWGYNTEKERKRAVDTGKIAVIDKQRLQQLAGTS